MPERPYLRIGETCEEGDDVVHHVLIVDDAELALPHEDTDELVEVTPELLPGGTGHDQRVVTAVLKEKKYFYLLYHI